MKRADSFIIGALLSFSGGLQDAYTYNVRDSVFANAQTGNIVLMSQNLMLGDLGEALDYFLPVISFISGIIVAGFVEYRFRSISRFSWKHLVILIEVLSLTAVGFIPIKYSMIPNMLVSFSCAIQVHSFKEIHGNRFASTMCIGNMSAATESLGRYFFYKEKPDLHKALILFCMIFIFALGAGFGGVMSHITKAETIWFSSVLLAVTGVLLNKNE